MIKERKEFKKEKYEKYAEFEMAESSSYCYFPDGI